jgi:Ca2+-binding RTX toxin-like protein
MTAYVNPTGYVDGTPEADSFLFNAPLQSWVTMDALGGIDQLTVDRSAGSASAFQARDTFNSGVFYGVVQTGPYDPQLTYYNVEDVTFVGSAFDDFFDVKVGPASAGLSIDIDGGSGVDTLALDFQTLNSGVVFQVVNGSITSSLGTFANLERFTITAGSGNDVIQTAGESDTIYAYGGADDIRTGAGNDSVYSETGGDYVDLGDGYDSFQGNYTADTAALTINIGDTITVSNGVTALNAETVTIGGGSGNDSFVVSRAVSGTLYGSSGSDTLTYSAPATAAQSFLVVGFLGRVSGGAGSTGFQDMERVLLTGDAYDDSFEIIGTYVPAAVRLDGSGGDDLLRARFSDFTDGTSFIVQADGTIVTSRGEFTSFEKFQLTGGSSADVFTTQGGSDGLDGAGGDDRLDGGAGKDFLAGGDGNDQLFGGAGDDELNGDSNDDILDGGAGADKMWGGPGNDIYYVDAGDSVVEAFANGGVDEIRTALATYTLQTDIEILTGLSATGQTLIGNSGDNIVNGGAGNDVLRLQSGGNDTVNGGAGSDNIFFIGSLTAADVVNGGSGTDTLVLQGAYGSLTLTSNVTLIENISILGGGNTNFGDPGTNLYDYVLTTSDANFAAGVQARINGSALLAGEDFTFNGSAETNASFVVYGGRGQDTFTGGLGNDIFFFAEARFASGDTVNGGSGYDGMFLRGNYTIDFNAPGYTGLFTSIENLTLTSATDERYARGGGTEFDYNITLSNAIVGAGQVLTVSGTILMASETMVLDGSQESDGYLRLFGGKADDTLKGGALGDLLHGNLGADILAGNGGADAFRYQALAESNTANMDHILDFTPGTDKIELDRIDANSLLAGDQAFAWIGSNAFSGVAGQLRAYQSGADWFVQGDVDGDGVADLVIQLTLQGPTPLGAGDFLL